MPQNNPAFDADERERLEHIAGYDRNFDPVAEALDLRIARAHEKADRSAKKTPHS